MYEDDIQTQLDLSIKHGMNWLSQSEIRCTSGPERGGFRSKYDPKTKEYEVWMGGITDALSTSGFIETALLHKNYCGGDAYDELIKESLQHLISLWDEDEGVMFAGLNSKTVYPLWLSQAANAFYLHFEVMGEDSSREVANKLAKWLINIQNPDGSIPKNQIWNGRIRKSPVSSWNTWAITTFLKSHEMGVEGSLKAAYKLADWMISIPEEDGSYCYNHGSINSIWRNIRDVKKNGLKGMFSTKTLWKHPTSQSHSYVAALEFYKKSNDKKYLESALRVRRWTYENLSPRKLMYEKYWKKERTVQEDVYPTAVIMMGDHLLYSITGQRQYLESSLEVRNTLLDCQFKSNDKNLSGSFPGVPLHPDEGHKAYTWDTVGALKALIDLHRILEIEKSPLEI